MTHSPWFEEPSLRWLCIVLEFGSTGENERPKQRLLELPIYPTELTNWWPCEDFGGIYNGIMKIENLPFVTTDWSKVSPTEHPGETGKAFWKTQQFREIRVRTIEYTPGYLADHWCTRGHVLLVIEGELFTELKDGRTFTLRPGMSYQVATDAEPHRSSTQTGAKLFVVD
jgi:hypothetical protein